MTCMMSRAYESTTKILTAISTVRLFLTPKSTETVGKRFDNSSPLNLSAGHSDGNN